MRSSKRDALRISSFGMLAAGVTEYFNARESPMLADHSTGVELSTLCSFPTSLSSVPSFERDLKSARVYLESTENCEICTSTVRTVHPDLLYVRATRIPRP